MASSRLPRARIGTTGTFALAGAVAAVGSVRIPALSDKLHLDPAAVGVAMLSMGIGALVGTQSARMLLCRFGSRRVLMIASPTTALLSGGSALAGSFPLLIAAFLAFGLAFGLLDSTMNAQAATLERVAGRHLMNGAHAGWSVGAVAGGIIGALTARLGIGYTGAVLGTAVIALPIALALATTYIEDGRTASEQRAGGRMPPVIYLIGVVTFASFVIEGSVSNWSSLYLRDELGTREDLAALGYPSLELAMLVGRTFGDRIRAVIGSRTMLVSAGTIGVVGLALVVSAAHWWLCIAGFFVVGLATSTVVPLTFSIAGAIVPSGAGVAQAVTMGYSGMLLGPVALGMIADASSLRVTFAVVAGLSVAVSVVGWFLPTGVLHQAGGKQRIAPTNAGRPER